MNNNPDREAENNSISSSSNGLVQSLQRRIDPRVYPEEEEASMNNSTTP